MGYYISYNHLNYNITPQNKVAMIKKYPTILSDLKEECLGFREEADGGLCIDDWLGEKWGDQEGVLIKIAEFSKDGDGSKWAGEDGDSWEYRVLDGKSFEYSVDREHAKTLEALNDILSRYPEEAARFLNSDSLDVKVAARRAVGG